MTLSADDRALEARIQRAQLDTRAAKTVQSARYSADEARRLIRMRRPVVREWIEGLTRVA